MPTIKYTRRQTVEYVFTCWTGKELQEVREFLRVNELTEDRVLHRDECEILIAREGTVVQECEF